MSSPTPESNSETASSPTNERRGLLPSLEYLSNHKMDVLMWITRMATEMFILLYLIPFSRVNPYECYQKALFASGLTSVLRLHQRIPKVEFSREFLSRLLQEDSCHYFFFSLIFIYTYPTTLVLLPIFLFAFLHSTSFTSKVLYIIGTAPCLWGARMISTLVDQHYKSILRLIAFTEIFLMPLSVFVIFLGRGSILTSIVYYRFLTLRYQSKRNPYARDVFRELRLSVELLANQPGVPERLRLLCYKLIAFVSKLAPPVPSPSS